MLMLATVGSIFGGILEGCGIAVLFVIILFVWRITRAVLKVIRSAPRTHRPQGLHHHEEREWVDEDGTVCGYTLDVGVEGDVRTGSRRTMVKRVVSKSTTITKGEAKAKEG